MIFFTIVSRNYLAYALTLMQSLAAQYPHSRRYLALADDEDKLLGFCQLYPSFSSLSLKRVWILNDIFVAEDARRQLVADGLLQQAKKLAKETNAVRMRVATSRDNEVAQKVYESIGFVEDEQFKNYVLPINSD